MNNLDVQYRATIIRGKATSELDNLLPTYANIISELCPCEKEKFNLEFNEKLENILNKPEKKTLDNHRTEIAGKLFGMYYEENDTIFISERTEKYLDDSDQPAFFKDICFKFQFPNGMDKAATVKEKLLNELSLRQFPYILKCLLLGEQKKCYLTKDDVGYYILNSLPVLQGKVHPDEVIEKILEDRAAGVHKVVGIAGKASSYNKQHINEQINLLEVANLIKISTKIIYLNQSELEDIEEISSFWDKTPEFDVGQYNLDLKEERKRLENEWQYYFSKLNTNKKFITSLASLDIVSVINKPIKVDRMKIGDDGEEFVLNFEKEKVKKHDPALVRKVIHLGRTKGLGYDIQSVVGEGEDPEFVKYIEVKTTKRVTTPDKEKSGWLDTVNLTRNEWVAASQHKKFYSIYRVYFTPGHATIFIINDPYTKNESGTLNVRPTMYRLNINSSSIDDIQSKEREET